MIGYRGGDAERGQGGFIWGGVHARRLIGYRGRWVERGQRFHTAVSSGGCPRSEVVWVQRHWGRAWTAVSYSGFMWGVSTLGRMLGTEADQSSVDRAVSYSGFMWGVHARRLIGYRCGAVERGQGGFMWGVHARYVFGYRGTGVERGHARRTEPLADALLPGARRKNAATAPPLVAALTGAPLQRAFCRAQRRQGQQRSADRGSGGFIQGFHARQNVEYRGGSVERGKGGFIQRFHTAVSSGEVSTLGGILGIETVGSSVDSGFILAVHAW